VAALLGTIYCVKQTLPIPFLVVFFVKWALPLRFQELQKFYIVPGRLVAALLGTIYCVKQTLPIPFLVVFFVKWALPLRFQELQKFNKTESYGQRIAYMQQ